MDIKNNNLVNISSNGIKPCNNQLKLNKNMSFSGVSAINLPMKPIINVQKVTEKTKVIQEGVKEAKAFSTIHADQELSPDAASWFYRGYSKYFKHIISPITEKYYTKPHVRDEQQVKKLQTCESISGLVGNSAKELTCMLFYPLMTLTNQDMSTDKKRFVGIYDFFVTCFSLSGSLAFALMKKQTDYLPIKQIAKYEKQGFKGLPKAQKGAAFVFNVALQTLLCKRILAPAFSPPLAAGVRKWLEKNDAKKAGATAVVAQPQDDKKNEKTASNAAVKPTVKAEQKQSAKPADKVADKPATKPAEKPADKVADKPATKPAEKPADKVADKPATKPAEKPADKVADKPATKPAEKPADKVADKPATKPAEKPADKVADKPATKPAEKPADKVADKPATKPADKSTDKVADKQEPEQNLFAIYKKSTQKTDKTA